MLRSQLRRPLVPRRYDSSAAGGTVSTGVGLANIRDRLAQAYGENHRFEIVTPPEGGFTVIIEIPYELHEEPSAEYAAAKPAAAPAVASMPGQRAMGTQA